MITQPNDDKNLKTIKTGTRDLTVQEYLYALKSVAMAYVEHPKPASQAECITTAKRLRAVLDSIGVADAWAWNEMVWANSPALYAALEMNQTFLDCWLDLVVA